MTTSPAPIHGTWPPAQAWLATLGPGADPLAETAAWAPVFSHQSFPPGSDTITDLWTTGGDINWLGGPAIAPLPQWPRNTDGQPLAHVATISLPDLHAASDTPEKLAWPDHRQGLPTTGALEVFHDLQVYGWEPSDRDTNGWYIRWVPTPDRTHLIPAPDDLETPSEVHQAGLFLPGFSTTAPLDLLQYGEATFDAAETVQAQLQEGWRRQMGAPYPTPVTHAYGHSTTGAEVIRDTLNDLLPLSHPDDDHRLVLEIESWTHLAGWFGDAAPLEIWIRQTDLDAQRFDEAWCITRTD
ncbi:DUF1963 domain-containing protein [Sanguibacter massiliensis]|uniref:DUF1963 domain-containing protein n=1 Tax=Sanguibacter massiliensis TaxID=1973217 RepID=UPI000C814967|nr:DUF1963 domain-containing protein [Sanguibacter massiliensis]